MSVVNSYDAASLLVPVSSVNSVDLPKMGRGTGGGVCVSLSVYMYVCGVNPVGFAGPN